MLADFVVPYKRRPPGLTTGLLESARESAVPSEADASEERVSMAETCAYASTCPTTEAPEDMEVEVPLGATLLEIYAGFKEEQADMPARFVRLAFQRFSVGEEVPRERLHDALVHLGFLTSTPEKAMELAGQLSHFHSFDLADFSDYVGNFANRERAALRHTADDLIGALQRGSVAHKDVQHRFVRSVGMMLSDSSIERAQKAATSNLREAADISVDDLLLTLASCRVDEGFTKEEVATAHEIFDDLEQEPYVSQDGWGPQILARELAAGLIAFRGVYSVDHMAKLMSVMPTDMGSERGVCFYEFLVWARRLRDVMTKELSDSFTELNHGGSSGLVELEGAIGIVGRSGITLLEDATQELLEQMGLRRGDKLGFDAVVGFVETCRRCHGFSRDELEELSATFAKFDDDSNGELTNLEFLDLLRYLGHTAGVEEARALIKRADFNSNGTLDREEFFRLMRLMREKDIEDANACFKALGGADARLPTAKVRVALAKMQLFPQDSMLNELLQERHLPAELDFTTFMRFAERCRFIVNLEFRKHAGFPDATVLELAEVWRQGGPTRTFATVGEVVWMLSDSQVRVNTKEGRRQLLERVEAARHAALVAGVPESEVVRQGTTDVGFFTFLHLVRSIVRDSESAVVNRECEALALTRFTSTEANEFRKIFKAACNEKADDAQSRSRPADQKSHSFGEVLSRLTSEQGMPDKGVLLLLRSIGLSASAGKLKDLTRFLNKTRTVDETDEIFFATFLIMMRWMMDTNFADICSVMDRRGISLSHGNER